MTIAAPFPNFIIFEDLKVVEKKLKNYLYGSIVDVLLCMKFILQITKQKKD